MSGKDPFLNETGRVNMGDLSNLKPDASGAVKIFGADGKVDTSSKDDELTNEAKEFAKALVSKNGVTWHKDDAESEKQGKDMFFPQLRITGVAEKIGVSRPFKEFFPNERNLYITAFMNDCAEYLFGVSAFNEIDTKNGVAFRPNKEWERLPVKS